MTSDHNSYGKNLETCQHCKAVSHLFSLEELIRLRDERPNFNHIYREGGELVAFSSEYRQSQGQRHEDR